MEYKKIEGTDLRISRIALGTWALGGWMWGGTDEETSIHTIRHALDLGINIIDTAPVYGFGLSEQIVGKAIQEFGKRDQVILATKTGLNWIDGKPFRDSSRARLKLEIEESLERLQTDYIDIYQVHWPDPNVSIRETAETLNEFLEEGKVRYLGVSNYSPEGMEEFRKYAPLHFLQPPYNLFERDFEFRDLPYCKEKGIATLSYGALCRGLLSGAMNEERQFEGDDLRKVDPKFQGERFHQYLQATRELEAFAAEHYKKNLIEFSIRWILDMGITSAIWGARKPEQLDSIKGISGWKIRDEDILAVDKILQSAILDPVGPEFMAPPEKQLA